MLCLVSLAKLQYLQLTIKHSDFGAPYIASRICILALTVISLEQYFAELFKSELFSNIYMTLLVLHIVPFSKSAEIVSY